MMNMRSIFSISLVAAATAVFGEEVDEKTAKEIADEASRASAQANYQSPFKPLPLCRVAQGTVEVKKPSSAEWQAAEEGRFYPLGSSFRTAKYGKLVVSFGPECSATISGDASFGTRAPTFSESCQNRI